MSAWLSEANRIGNASKGQVMAEMSRQQTAMMKVWTEQMLQMQQQMMAIWFPWLPRNGRK